MAVSGAEKTEKPYDAAFAERLKVAVARAGGATVVSKRSGVPLSTLNDYLKGSDARLSKILKVAVACGVSLDWLAGGGEAIPASGSSVRNFGFVDDDLDRPIHFWALAALLRTCQEFFKTVNSPVTLAEALEWIGRQYHKAAQLPDAQWEFALPKDRKE